MTDFEGVVPALSQALTKREYTALTPVQKAVLAPEMSGADALVSAQTGSGKTVAFGLALAPTLLDGADKFPHSRVPLALVVAPTRELALQVKRELDWLYEMTGANIASCVGGMDMRTERRALERGAHIVVGTPGRLRDHIERGSLELSGMRAVVLDEADEMLDLGFRDDLEYILDAAPSDRRTLMFSATVPRSIANLATRYQRDAVRISTASDKEQHLDIEYQVFTVAPNDRENAIINLLRYYESKNTLVFCATRATVNHMTSRLNNRGFSVVALSGELSQNERTHALQAMRDGRARVCVATDVAARGIDLPNLDLVIHADVPRNSEALLHRSGRTGRAGRKGVSALIVPHNTRRKVERLLDNANIESAWGKPPSVDDIMKRDRERILDDPALSEDLNEDEQAFAQELLSRHSAEQIAAAFVRMHRAENPAPEELIDAGPMEEKKARREDFKGGVWFSISVGRKDHAEPRWLLPTLCRAGHITKNEIGAIRIQETESFVELAPDCVAKFLEALGPSRKMEKNIEVTRLDGVPAMAKEARGPSGGRKKSYEGAGSEGRAGPGGKRKFERKSSAPREDRGTDSYAGSSTPKRKFDRNTGAPKAERSSEGYSGSSAPKRKFERNAGAPRVERTAEGQPSSSAPKRKYEQKSKAPWEERKPREKTSGSASNQKYAGKPKARREEGMAEAHSSSSAPKRKYEQKPDTAKKGKKPWDKFENKAKSDKPHKSNNPKKAGFSKSGPKKVHTDMTGASPLKRKKLSIKKD